MTPTKTIDSSANKYYRGRRTRNNALLNLHNNRDFLFYHYCDYTPVLIPANDYPP